MNICHKIIEKINTLLMDKRRKYYVLFTLLFIIVACIVFIQFYFSGKSFIWSNANEDGLVQHCNALMYYGQYWRSILKSIFIDHQFTFPMYDFSIGFGADIISTLHYYCFGDPLDLLAIFVPSRFTEYLFNFLVVLRLYLAGIAFSAFCFHKKKEYRAIFIGTFIYVFCGFSLFAIRHPYFLNTMIYLPIICIGIDYIIDRKSPSLFAISITITLLCNFYFFYMITILIFIYALFSYFSRTNMKSIKHFLCSFFKCFWFYILGIGMACVIFIPVVLLFTSTARASDRPYIPILYTLSYYLKIFGGFTSMNMTGYWSNMAFAVPSLLGIVCLFFMDKSRRMLKILFLLLTLFLCVPFIGSLMNGLSYISNRWIFGYVFLIAYIFVDTYPHMPKLCQKYRIFLLFFILGYILLNILYDQLNNLESYIALGLLVLCFLSLLLCLNKRNVQFICILTITFISIGINANMLYAESQQNYTSEFLDSGTFYETMKNSSNRLLPDLNDEFARYDLTKDKNYHHNNNLNTHQSTLSYYYSLCLGDISRYLFELENLNTLSSQFSGVNERTFLEALMSSKYYIASVNGKNRIPFGFKKDTELSSKSTTYDIYKNKYWLPLGITYDSEIEQDKYQNLNAIQKQEVLLQSAVVEDVHLSTHHDLQFDNESMNYVIEGDDNIIIKENKFYILKNNASITLKFDGKSNSETYVRFGNLNYQFNDDSDISKELAQKGHNIFDATLDHGLPSINHIRISSDTQQRNTLSIKSKYYMYYNGTVNYLANTGYTEKPRQSITLTFPEKGVFSFESLEVIAQPMTHYPEYIEKLKTDTLENVELKTNKVIGNLTLNKDKLLMLSIPYSKGWTIKIDGEKVDNVKVNTMFLGAYVTKGKHIVELEYTTPGLEIGTMISVTSCILFIGSLKVRRWYHQKDKSRLMK